MLLALVGDFLPLGMFAIVSGISVTDTSNYVMVDNDYYIANISKVTSGIEKFYIKPYDTVNIVHYPTYPILGMHEIEYYIGDIQYSSMQKSSAVNEHYDTSVMYNDGSTVVVRSLFRLHDSGENIAVNMTEWRTFYANKPWFVVTFTQEFLTDGAFWNENQCCFLYNKDYPSTWSVSNDNGTIITDAPAPADFSHLYSAKYNQRYPWVHIGNSTYETGLGQILIDVYPRSYNARIGEWFGTAYKEWQLTLNEHAFACVSGFKQTATYINYVAYDKMTIDNFSKALYKSNHRVTSPQDFIPFRMNNRSHWEYGLIGKSGDIFWNLPSTLDYGRMYYWLEQEGGGGDVRYVYFKYTNGSGTYNALTVDGWTFPERYWDATYCNLTARNDYESKLRWEIITEAWRDNDAIKTTIKVEALTTINATDLYIDFDTWPDNAWVSITHLTNSITILNATNTKVSWMYDYGHAFKNLTAYATRTNDTSNLYYYLLDNVGDVDYSSGQTWSLTLKIHKFIRTEEQGTLFQASDFLETGSELKNFNHHIWTPLPFPEIPSGNATFYMEKIAGESFQLIRSTYSVNKLTLKVAGESGELSTLEIYCGNKGQPVAIYTVNGTLTWSYNASTAILTLKVTHASPTTILIYWRLPGDVNDDDVADVVDLALMGKAYGATCGCPNWNEGCDINGDEIIDEKDLSIEAEDYGKRQS